MQLLVSVADAREAIEALSGGADIIDAKDPRQGPLGPVDPAALAAIREAVAGARPLSAALGDAADAAAVEMLARSAAAAGASFVKVGLAGIGNRDEAERLIAAAMRGAADGEHNSPGCAVVAVAYADASAAASLSIATVISIATERRCRGLLIDTFDKAGPGLCNLLTGAALAHYVELARRGGLFVTLAGRLCADDLDTVRDAGADVAGVRGAACDGGRAGRLRADRVRTLRARLHPELTRY